MKITFRRILLMLLGLGVVGLIAYALLPKPVPVDIAEVERGTLLVTVDEDGKTRIKKHARYVIAAPIEAFVPRIRLDPGDDVSSGEVVVALEPRDAALLDPRTRAEAEARMKAAEAAVNQAEAQARNAEKAHQLARTLLERGAMLLPSNDISREDYDTLVHKEMMALEELNAARFAANVKRYERDIAKATLERTHPRSPTSPPNGRFELWSPIAGSVLRIFEDYDKTATVVPAGTRLLEIGDTSAIEIEIDVLSQHAVKIKEGNAVILEQWGGDMPLYGKVWRIEPGGFLKVSALGVEEQRVNVIVHFDEAKNEKVDPDNLRSRLKDAFRVEARIVIWEGKDVVKVPTGALFRNGESWAAFAIRDSVAELVPVTVGHSNGLYTEILDGLEVGDKVILHPSDQVRPGVQVTQRQ